MPRSSLVDHVLMDHAPKIIVWNVRGLNARARRTAIRSLIVSTNASVVCLQETKMELITVQAVRHCLGNKFENFFYLPLARVEAS